MGMEGGGAVVNVELGGQAAGVQIDVAKSSPMISLDAAHPPRFTLRFVPL
jgi:hypothetical protein